MGNRREKAMIARPSRANVPPQLHDLSLKAEELPDVVRGALQATLSVAAVDATQEQVLVDTFARLGYLPEEAKQATLRLLT
jgi:non-ribosomal peptide synthetase component F